MDRQAEEARGVRRTASARKGGGGDGGGGNRQRQRAAAAPDATVEIMLRRCRGRLIAGGTGSAAKGGSAESGRLGRRYRTEYRRQRNAIGGGKHDQQSGAAVR